MKIENIKLSELRENKNNPRKIKKDQLEKLKNSIKDFPQMLEIRPIVVDENNIILGGNMRLKALKELGYTEVPHIKVSDLTPEQQKEFIIKDNLSYGDWDWEIMSAGWDIELMDDWGLEVPLFDFPLLQQQETIGINEIDYHPKNYKQHPQDQIDHLVRSIQEHGLYRNIVISNDNKIIIGNGLVQALRYIGIKKIPVIRLDISHDSIEAEKLMIADNEISHLSVLDDRMLTDVLKKIRDNGELNGTGFDEMMLANLLMVTRPSNEIRDINNALEWVGMPEHIQESLPYKIIFNFRNEEARDDFQETFNFDYLYAKGNTWTTWYPFEGRDDVKSLRFE